MNVVRASSHAKRGICSWRHRFLVVLGATFAAATAGAQNRPATSREMIAGLDAKLSAATRDTLLRILDSASAAGIPSMPLAAKAAEGVLKGVDEARILRAVRNLARQIRIAGGVLRPGAANGTLVAAANALQAGVSARALARLVAVSPRDDAGLAIAFVTIADLVANNISGEMAAAAIEQLLQRRAPEAEMAALRSAVARDIQTGRSPEDALATHTKAIVQTLNARLAKPE